MFKLQNNYAMLTEKRYPTPSNNHIWKESLACIIPLTSPRMPFHPFIIFEGFQPMAPPLSMFSYISFQRSHDSVLYIYCHYKSCWGEKYPPSPQKHEEWRAEIGLRTSKCFACLCSGYTLLVYYSVLQVKFPLRFWLKCGYRSQKHLQASIPDLAALATKWQASNATLTWCLAVSIPSRTVVLKSSCLPCGRKEENSGTLLHKLR